MPIYGVIENSHSAGPRGTPFDVITAHVQYHNRSWICGMGLLYVILTNIFSACAFAQLHILTRLIDQ